MSFSRWYPVSSYYYDPAIQPTKPIINLQQANDSQYRKIPKGRYDTTYRREYLNFGQNSSPENLNYANQYLLNSNYMANQPVKDAKSNQLNQYTVLPPISPQRNQQQQPSDVPNVPSIDHLIVEPISKTIAENFGTEVPMNQNHMSQQYDMQPYSAPQKSARDEANYLPREPIQLSDQEEYSLQQDVTREIASYSTEQLKSFYSELSTYDPNVTGYIHHMYVTLVAMRNKLPLNDSLLRFLMCKFVSPSQEPGYINYENLVKYLAKCMGDANRNPPMNQPGQSIRQSSNSPMRSMQPDYDYSRMDNTHFDPDEQAILRLLQENMKDWDKVNYIDTDLLRKHFYDLDQSGSYVLTQRQIEDVLYKHRIPIQRSLVYQILEKYCKAQTSLYRWPAFVDFLEKTSSVPTKNGRKPDSLANQYNQGQYGQREDDKDIYSSEKNYRSNQLDTLRRKVTEEERLDEIERQIYNLQSLKKETQQRIDSRLGDVTNGESWFTRFMRLANAMYSHRIHAGIDFTLPKEEARRLVIAYNTVYDLNIPEQQIEDGLNRCTRKGNVLIDDLLKVLAKVK